MKKPPEYKMTINFDDLLPGAMLTHDHGKDQKLYMVQGRPNLNVVICSIIEQKNKSGLLTWDNVGERIFQRGHKLTQLGCAYYPTFGNPSRKVIS